MIVTFKFEFLLSDNTHTVNTRTTIHQPPIPKTVDVLLCCLSMILKVYLLLFFYVVDAKRTGFEFGCQSGIDQPPTQYTQCQTPLLKTKQKEKEGVRNNKKGVVEFKNKAVLCLLRTGTNFTM